MGASLIVSVIYLAIYFQAVKGTSAVQSGINTIALLLATSLGAIVGGAAVSRIGYYTPFMIAGAPIMATGAGLLTTFRPDTSEGRWIGYQIVFGFGAGICMQQSSVAAQTILSRKDIAIGSSLMMFAQQLSGAIFVPVAQSIFQNRLMDTLSNLPGIDASKIGSVGATELRSVVPPAQLESVLAAFNHALIATFYVVTAASCVAIFPALAMEWRSVKAKKKEGSGGEKGMVTKKVEAEV
jgi:MFS family permease